MSSIRFLLLLVVVCVSQAQYPAAGDDSMSAQATTTSASSTSASTDECTYTGYKCSSDCTQLVECVRTGSHFQSVTTKCESNELCDPYRKECSSSFSKCPKFSCGGKGVFPDVIDCATFHICDGDLNNTPGTCEAGYAFNPMTQDCSIEIAKNKSACENPPVPPCNGTKRYGIVPSNHNIYYACADGTITLYYCEANTVFNPEFFECEDLSLACARIGLYADPNNCKRYYECTTQGTFASHKTCPEGMYFNYAASNCVTGKCGIQGHSLGKELQGHKLF